MQGRGGRGSIFRHSRPEVTKVMLAREGAPAVMKWEEVSEFKGQGQSSWSSERRGELRQGRLWSGPCIHLSICLYLSTRPFIYILSPSKIIQDSLHKYTSQYETNERGHNQENKIKLGDQHAKCVCHDTHTLVRSSLQIQLGASQQSEREK